MSKGEGTIEISHVSKVIKNEKQKNIILKDISFSLEAGTVTAIVGKSGCGKSTLLSIASGIDAPTEGSVRLLGKDFYKMETSRQEYFRNENIGVLFQNYHLIPELTCEENIRMPLCFSNGGASNGKKLDQWIRGGGAGSEEAVVSQPDVGRGAAADSASTCHCKRPADIVCRRTHGGAGFKDR